MIAIGVGFAAVNMFGGFTEYVFRNLKDSFIYSQGNGHLTIARPDFFSDRKSDPLACLIAASEWERIEKICLESPEILLITPQLQLTGLISNGSVSTIFIGVGRVPSALYDMQRRARGMLGGLKLFTGKKLSDDKDFGIGLSAGLARKLELALDSDAIVVSPTLEGRINALDAQIFQTFPSPVEALDDKLAIVPLQFAQSLYDTNGIDRVTVLLKDDGFTVDFRDRLQQQLVQQGLEMEVKTWEELSPFYRKVKDMFDIIFMFLFLIVFVIVVTSVVNTSSMSVMERTREIGVLRSLGLNRFGIVRLFATESCVLGGAGSLLGAILTVVGCLAMRILGPTWVPPNIPMRIPLEVYLVPRHMLVSFVFLMALSVASAMLPARKAACKSIVDALRYA